MSQTHDLRVSPDEFDAIRAGRMKAQFRKDEPSFRAGDNLILREWDNVMIAYTGKWAMVQVTHVSVWPQVPEGYCVLSHDRVFNSGSGGLVAAVARLPDGSRFVIHTITAGNTP